MKKGFILDIDGVVAETPHEEAWKESLEHLFNTRESWQHIGGSAYYTPGGFTTTLYRERISGKPRIDGARAALAYFGIRDPENVLSEEYAAAKQETFLRKIEEGNFKIYDDALLLLLEAKQRGILLVAASSSKNANSILERIAVQEFVASHVVPTDRVGKETTVLELFDGNVCGIDLRRGKPDPEIFLRAASSVELRPEECLVIEDAFAGIRAARAGGFFCVGIARLDNEAELRRAGADIVTDDLRLVFSQLFDA